MIIGLVNLVTKTSEIVSDPKSMIKRVELAPRSDADLNIVEMGRRIASRGNEVRIIIADAFRPSQPMACEDSLRIDYIPTKWTRIFPPALAPFTPSLVRYLRGEGFDIVQSGELFQPGTLLSWLGLEGTATRMFIWQELDVLMRPPAGYFQKGYYRTIGKAVARDCKCIIPRSISAQNHLLHHGVPEEKIGPVVHSGVDTRAFKPLDKESCRSAFGIEGAEQVILAIARLSPAKGLDTLIEAMVGVAKETPDSVLVIKGNGPAYAELNSLVKSLGIQKNVRFITDSLSVDEMPRLYNISDVLAITSRIDLFPFVAIEAISCGIPLATSFPRGLKTDIVDKGGGLMLPPYGRTMGEALVSILMDRDRLNELGRAGRNLAVNEFDFEVCAQRFLRIYEGI